MADADTSDTETGADDRCMALTADGERCSLPAQEDGFCHQHDESDPTVSDTETEQPQQEESEPADETSADAETTDPDAVDASDVDVDDDRIEAVLSIRQTVKSTAGQLIGREFDGVSEVTAVEDGWRAVVEVVERRAVPDTQDIVGRYEIDLDEDGVVEGYRRLDRYRRGDSLEFDKPVE
ncbi:gas vesicle protein GvpO, halophile-type [Natrialbaceae archaeon AArc-T1-2]|uniref:gas vesicle protein GvpO, halophile-type n=1 Tax=Natrialbaceae archaeon AArc-T1-2 TaxID=3053904 RepID=UPI00255AA5AC|nr:gas vesicle protein GvpO [Natrialbaceae archaeon AArc-T1-2]WIV67595.1 gas vesicle protein GvpO [Natrialbaceae archaeon AArc-T1-2]